VPGEKLEAVGEEGAAAVREEALNKRWWVGGRGGWAGNPGVVARFPGGKTQEDVLVPEVKGELFMRNRGVDDQFWLDSLQEVSKGVPARDHRPRLLEEPKFGAASKVSVKKRVKERSKRKS
jgi:hypothetical protein